MIRVYTVQGPYNKNHKEFLIKDILEARSLAYEFGDYLELRFNESESYRLSKFVEKIELNNFIGSWIRPIMNADRVIYQFLDGTYYVIKDRFSYPEHQNRKINFVKDIEEASCLI